VASSQTSMPRASMRTFDIEEVQLSPNFPTLSPGAYLSQRNTSSEGSIPIKASPLDQTLQRLLTSSDHSISRLQLAMLI
jgi:hypothetical protein